MPIIRTHTDHYTCECGKSWCLTGAKGKGSTRNSIHQILKLHKRICDVCSWTGLNTDKASITINTGRGQGNANNAPLGNQLDKINDAMRGVGDTSILEAYKMKVKFTLNK